MQPTMSYMAAPQAYTKETLSKAFDWLQYQPEQVKLVATTPEALVGLYLKAQRQGIDNIDVDAPVSSKRFISDLKNLKKDFAPFDEPSTQDLFSPTHTSTETSTGNKVSPQLASQLQTSSPQIPISNQHPQTQHLQNVFQTQISQTNTISETKSVTFTPAFDANSIASIEAVQSRFNLSSPQEALRLIIAVGAKHISTWE